MRILLLGGSGQVGHALATRHRFSDMTVATRRDCDLADASSLRQLVRRVAPEVIVNAAAYTAVDRAEAESAICHAVNAAAPGILAEEACALGARLVHYSTDYVFDGTRPEPYREEDPAAPRNVYGASKLAGERAIADSRADALVLRTSWVYGNHGANFMKTMLRLGSERQELRIVADQRGAPTSAEAIADATARILEGAAGGKDAARGEDAADGRWHAGLFHMTAAGETTWHGFAAAIFERAGAPGPRLVPISSAEYPTPAARPANSVLSNAKFASVFGWQLPGWEDQLDEVMAARHAEAHARS